LSRNSPHSGHGWPADTEATAGSAATSTAAGAAEQKRRERNGTGWRREAVGRREAEVRRQERRKEELRVRLKTLEEEAMADGKRWPRRSGEHGGCVGGARRDPVSRRGEWVEVRVCRV